MVSEQGSDTALVVFQGALTHAQFESFSRLMDRLHAVEAQRFVLDLSDVDFIDSSGIGMLLMTQDLAEKRAYRCVLRGISATVWNTLVQAQASDLFFFETDPESGPQSDDHIGPVAA